MNEIFLVLMIVPLVFSNAMNAGTCEHRLNEDIIEGNANETFSITMNKFTFKLFQNIVNRSNENLVFFPLNIAKLLFMVFLGADDQVAWQIEKVMRTFLHATNFHTDLHNFFYEWRHEKNRNTYKAIDKMYVASSVSLRAIYKRIAHLFYRHVLTWVNFSKIEAKIKKLVAWVTGRSIGNIMKEKYFTPDMLLSLWSVVSYYGEWNSGQQSPRRKEYSKNNDARGSNFVSASVNYRKDHYLNCQLVELPMGNKGLSLFLVIPSQVEKFKRIMGMIDTDILNDWVNLKGFEKTRVAIQKVKFEVEAELHLEKILPMLGITDLFQKPGGLSKMSTQNGLFVNKFIQRSFMEIRPDTETGSRNRERFYDEKIIEVNRPFFFFIADKATKVVISAGSIIKQ